MGDYPHPDNKMEVSGNPLKLEERIMKAFTIKKSILSISKTRISEIIIKLNNCETGKEVLKIKEINCVKISTRLSLIGLTSSYILQGIDTEYSLDDIKSELENNNYAIFDVQRFTKKTESEFKPIKTIKVTKIGCSISESVPIGPLKPPAFPLPPSPSVSTDQDARALHRQTTSSAQYIKYGTEERFAFQCLMMSSDRKGRGKDCRILVRKILGHVPGKDNIIADALYRIDELHLQPTIDYEDIAKAQEVDEELKEILSSHNSSLKLEKIPIFGSNFDIFCDCSAKKKRPYIPEAFRKIVFNNIHNLAHPGIRTTNKIVNFKICLAINK
ncbi:uncharacterized protein TNCV_1079761 [Trichonephila clavipes]|nr:uncharacterized protein TNCV_1079761 [Trichonephila clavipes]